jgi:hypothetical protein
MTKSLFTYIPGTPLTVQLYDVIIRLKGERDEARILYCREMADIVKPYRSAEDIAKDRNWDCFIKESSNDS